MNPLGPFPDVEDALCNILDGVDGVTGSGTTAPAEFGDEDVFVRVVRFGGTSDRVSDQPLVAVDVLAGKRALAWPVAQEIHQLMLSRVLHDPTTSTTASLMSVVSAPAELPWSEKTRRFGATYRLSVRR